MSRIIWILVLLIGAVLFIKPLRERARPQIEFVLNPVYKWEAKNRVNEIYRVIQREKAQGIPIPRPREFQDFLSRREGPQAALDPWGEPLYLEVGRNTLRVSSAGPDRTSGTEDDIHSRSEVVQTTGR